MSHRLNLEEAIKALTVLATTFPNCFSFVNPKPLKTKIHQDIFANFPQGISSKSQVRKALYIYTNASPYLKNFRNHTMRVDIHGNEVETIDVKHYVDAKKRIDTIRKNRKNATNGATTASGADAARQ